MNQNTRARPPAIEAVRDVGDLSAVRGAVIGSVFGCVLWGLFGLAFVIFRAAF